MVSLPIQWLACNAKDLGHYGVSNYDMGSVLDVIKFRFEDISKRRLYGGYVLLGSCQSLSISKVS
jgi:hypothetical protein